ncbi:hypothetical protein UPYG_G00322050 [Umbra pygmaea]|uniref:Uncharacterized protein n=1 Tax=Umbra pygmaea TaxID=75934 RepID=A0ABD0W553_UMBPY
MVAHSQQDVSEHAQGIQHQPQKRCAWCHAGALCPASVSSIPMDLNDTQHKHCPLHQSLTCPFTMEPPVRISRFLDRGIL